MTTEDRFAGTLQGLAVGDAVGTAVEFLPRGSFDPVTDMVGGGPFELPAGCWTDVGNTTRRALERFERTGEPFSGPTEPRSAGNGSIMRLAPVVLCYHPDRQRAMRLAAESSRTTHGTPETVNGCHVLAGILHSLLEGRPRRDAIRSVEPERWLGDRLMGVARADYTEKSESEVRGSGYVVESLEAALWCFVRANSFRDAVLMAANLGDDADTTAAVCGQLAGAYWGESGIPDRWLGKLTMAGRLRSDAVALGAAAF